MLGKAGSPRNWNVQTTPDPREPRGPHHRKHDPPHHSPATRDPRSPPPPRHHARRPTTTRPPAPPHPHLPAANPAPPGPPRRRPAPQPGAGAPPDGHRAPDPRAARRPSRYPADLRGDLRGQAGLVARSRRPRGRCPSCGRGKKGLREALAAEASAEVGRLAAEAARALGCDSGLEAAEAVIRAGMLKLGGGVLGKLLGADPGYRGPRVDCGAGHQAEFVSYRDKVIDTVLGPVTITRAWYHCADCKHGLAPRDAELGVTAASMSPGLAAINDQAAAAAPFAKAAGLLDGLAGVRLTVKRVERAAEASGAAQAAAVRDRARLIAGRKLVPLPPSPVPDMLYGAIDGTGVTMTAKETAGRQGKGEDGRARTREVKLGVFFIQDEVDDDGYPVRDQGSASYIATFEPAAVFGDLVKAEGIRRGAGHVRQASRAATSPASSASSRPVRGDERPVRRPDLDGTGTDLGRRDGDRNRNRAPLDGAGTRRDGSGR